ncbi:MAG: DNA translocase FtsK 4TM domain-containing protein [Gemmatimonadota bacterium]|nr:MAG: DNA translocase FtsK 4TM domain-containing protein [Gemmatimonadota bacterium]
MSRAKNKRASGRQTRNEALGVALLALGALLLLAVGLPRVAGGRNPIGPVGALLDSWFLTAFGGFGFLIAAPALVWGLHSFGLIGRSTAVRGSVLALLVLAFAPTLSWMIDGRFGGWIGGTIGPLLVAGFGTVGALLIVVAVLLIAIVLTLELSVARAMGRLAGFVWRGARGAVRLSWRALRRAGLWLAAVVDGFRADRRRPESPWESVAAEPGEDAPVAPPAQEAEAQAPAGEAAPEVELAEGDVGDLSQTELPPLDLLTEPAVGSGGLGEQELKSLGTILVDKLRTFRVEGRISGWTTGPVVTQFEIVPAAGVKVGQIAALSDDLALALKAPSVRIVAPIPGKGAVGVEVPNPEPEIVWLREVLESPAYRRAGSTLPIALGRDLAGRPYVTDLARMPHLLIAGATGTGKSICINAIITSLVYRFTPAELRLLMVDPKMVELSVYNDLPHLRHPVVIENSEAASILKWAVYEMGRRYSLLSANGCRNLQEFNARVSAGREIRMPEGYVKEYDEGPLPFIVLLVDELADLIMTVQAEVEGPLAILAQKARAVGLHLVIATQRPSVNVITGLIKANFPSRIAFRVASKTDSRTILDQNGAESLLGNGDMLFLPPGEADPIRIQGAFISSDDTERLVEWYRLQAAAREEAPAAEEDILLKVRELEADEAKTDVAEDVLSDWDDLFPQAAEIVVANSSGSTSLLQRRLKIGYGRAARIVDQLHHAGILGPPDGSRPREVLVGFEDLSEILESTGHRARPPS